MTQNFKMCTSLSFLKTSELFTKTCIFFNIYQIEIVTTFASFFCGRGKNAIEPEVIRDLTINCQEESQYVIKNEKSCSLRMAQKSIPDKYWLGHRRDWGYNVERDKIPNDPRLITSLMLCAKESNIYISRITILSEEMYER